MELGEGVWEYKMVINSHHWSSLKNKKLVNSLYNNILIDRNKKIGKKSTSEIFDYFCSLKREINQYNC